MNLSKLSVNGGMWDEWQNKVKAAGQNFASDAIYCSQTGNGHTDSDYIQSAKEVAKMVQIDPDGKTRDTTYGARTVETVLGPVTRMWLDGNVEYDFLRRNYLALSKLRVLEIGAGYGRLAVMLRPLVASYTCVDAVPISTELCRQYTTRFAPDVRVSTLQEFVESPGQYDLAINIHSWNECSGQQVTNWIDCILELKIPYLFTVDHGNSDVNYMAWGGPCFRPLLEKHFSLVNEEILSMEQNPHALWRLK